jgi:Na+/phosphate symporter
VLPYVGVLRTAGVAGYAACGATGMVLAAVLQGPAPVFALVLSLVQSTGALDLPHALAVLSGTALGAAIDTTAVAWSFGRDARRLALAHLGFGTVATLAVLATATSWASLADVLVSGDPAKVAYGKKVLLPNVDEHLAVGFVASQLFVGLIGALGVPWLARLARRIIPQRDGRVPRLLLHRAGDDDEGAAALGQRVLGRVVRHQRVAVEAALQLCCTGDRAHQTASEHALADARADLEEIFPSLVGVAASGHGIGRLRHSATATLQLQRSVEDLLRLTERCVERNFTLDSNDYDLVRTVHDLLLTGMATLIEALEGGDMPDLEQARSREILLNAREAAGRQELLGAGGLEARSTRARLRVIELLDAYENVGNHLYRVYESFLSDVDEAVA